MKRFTEQGIKARSHPQNWVKRVSPVMDAGGAGTGLTFVNERVDITFEEGYIHIASNDTSWWR